MKYFVLLLFLLNHFSGILLAAPMTDIINGVKVKTEKKNGMRSYVGYIEKILPYSIEYVKMGTTNFSEKCNNNYKSKRKYTDKKANCKYHNDNLVESFTLKNIRQHENFKDFNEVYLLGRLVYNRGSFGYYELVKVKEETNHKKLKTISITMEMLNDNQVKKYISPKFSKESAFNTSICTFNLRQIGPEQTLVGYEYSALTDHWLLNKDISITQVFSSISKGINDLMITVEKEADFQKKSALVNE